MKLRLIIPAILIAASPSAFAGTNSLAGGFVGGQLSDVQLTTAHWDNNYWYYNNQDFKYTDSGVGLGVRGGYNWVSGSMIYGALGEYSLASVDNITELTPGSPSYRTGSRVSGFGSVRGRFGYTTSAWAMMGTLGLAVGQIKNKYNETDGSGQYLSESQKTVGTVFGITTEVVLSAHAVLGIDYSIYSWGKSTHMLLNPGGGANGSTFSYEDKINSFTVSYNYKF